MCVCLCVCVWCVCVVCVCGVCGVCVWCVCVCVVCVVWYACRVGNIRRNKFSPKKTQKNILMKFFQFEFRS